MNTTLQLSLITLLSLLILISCAHKQSNEIYTQDSIGTQVDIGLDSAIEEKEDNVTHILFIGSSSMAAAGGQHHLVAAMLRAQGWQVETDKIYGPGLTVVRLMRHNAGLALTKHQHKLESLKKQAGAQSQAYREMKKQIYDFVNRFKGVFDKKIEQGHWDYVVLDAHPLWGTPEEFNQRLDEAIFKIRQTNPQAKIILYSLEKSSRSMNEAEKMAYQDLAFKAAVRNGVLAVPKDKLRQVAHAARPDLSIYRSPTDHHDGIAGAYLTACGLYRVLTGKTPLGLPNRLLIPTSYDFHQGEQHAEFFIPQQAAQMLQIIARDVCRDYLKRLQAAITSR